jgi:hypothetical protein
VPARCLDTIRSHQKAADGTVREYRSQLLRHSFSDEQGRPRKETLANLTALPDAALEAVRKVLRALLGTRRRGLQAMDWLASRQREIEKLLAARHLSPGGIAMSGLSSSWVDGQCCELAAFGHSRDGKRGRRLACALIRRAARSWSRSSRGTLLTRS